LAGLFTFSPTAFAHSAGASFIDSVPAGFSHPLHGWDHLLAMVAVGIWAAQQSGQLRWLLPATFVVVMTFGAIVGSLGAALPDVWKP
jgi:urease accessory protein